LNASDTPEGTPFRRQQRFTLQPAGRTAEKAYRSTIVASRERPGRAAFDEARTAWATSHGLHPDDGAYLGELRTACPVQLSALVESMRVCGKNRDDAVAALGRLVDGGFVSCVGGR